MNDLILVGRLLLALVFGVAGISKLGDRAGFRQALSNFGVPASLGPAAAVVLPLAELAVALTLLTRYAWYGAAGGLALLLLFIAGIGYNLAQGRHPDCRCFGQLQSKPVGLSTLVRNAVLAGVAGVILWPGREVAPTGLFERLGHLTGAQTALLVGALVMVLAVSGLVWFLAHLLTQQGRILTRLDALEARLAQLPSQAAGAAPNGPPAPQGLPVGAPAPAFRLANLSGGETGLAELLAPGLPLVLLFMDPHCGPCAALMPDVARWNREHAGRLTLAIVSRGKLKENRTKYGSAGVQHVLLQENYEVGERYSALGTPSAVGITPGGRIASAVLQGADIIRSTLDRRSDRAPGGNGAASQPPPAEASLAAVGTPAPEIRLPDLDGQTRQFRPAGADTVVLFWNPACGFCQQMLENLKEWERSDAPGKPDLLVVSTGTPESNRGEGFRSPVWLDSGFATATRFGAGGTPSAVLVDGQGKIASPVAVGAQAVLSLLAPLEVGAGAAR